MKSRKASMNVKRKVHNEYVLPVMVYGSETWALKKAHMELLSVAQRKMERIMLGITLRDHKRNSWIRHQTGVNDIIDVIKKGIRGWAGHIARFKDNRWTKRVTEWTQRLENGQDDREDLKQDGETTLSAIWVLRGQ